MHLSSARPCPHLHSLLLNLPLKRAAFWWRITLAPLLMLQIGGVHAAALNELIAEALRSHPTARAQQARVAAAQAGVSSAKWQFWPTPYASVDTANGSSNNPSYAGDSTVKTLGLRQPLWTGGRLSAELERARAAEGSAGAGAALARQQLALRVLQSYGDWLAAHLKFDAYDKGRVIHERLLEQVGRRVEEGQSARSDRVLAEGRLAAMNADLSSAQAQAEVGIARLSQLIGRPLQANELATQADVAPPLDDSLSDLIQHALSASPALAQYRAQADVELATVAQRKAQRWPEVSLRMERQYGNFSTGGAPVNNIVMIGVSTNFGAGLSTGASVDEAEGRHAAALADVEVQARELSEQVMVDHAVLVQSRSRRKALASAIELSDEVRESWDRQFLVGRKTWQDLMSSAREQVQIEAQLADVIAAQLVSSWRLSLLSRGVDGVLAKAPTNAPTKAPAPHEAPYEPH